MRKSLRRLGVRGGTLVEVVISILLVAIASTGIFGALFSASLQAGVSTDQELVALQLQSVLDELRNYVTQDLTNTPDAPGQVVGVNRNWHLQGDACACWALQEGVAHDVSSRLPPELAARARLSYRVTSVIVNGQQLRQVKATIDWTPIS